MNTIDTQQEIRQLANIGRQYPATFLDILQETACKAIISCLEANLPDIPEKPHLVQLVGSLGILESAAARQELGKMDDVEAFLLVEAVASITEDIAAIGGRFYGPDSEA